MTGEDGKKGRDGGLRKKLHGPQARVELLFLLLIFYIVYVVGDLITTRLLILNDPYGISHEANPIGRLLYLSQGMFGLMIAKFLVFIPLTFAVLLFEARFRNVWWFREMVETILLGLLTYSMIILLNNISAVILIQAQMGAPNVFDMYPIVKGFVLISSMALNMLILHIGGYGSQLRTTEVLLGTGVVAGPLLLFQPLVTFLSEKLWLLLLYVVSVFTILGTFFYILDEIRGERLRAS